MNAKKINIADTPDSAINYEMEDGRIYRIYTTLVTPHALLKTADNLEIETHGYQITRDGSFVVDDNGEPVMIPRQRTRIPMSSIRNGSDTANPGWIRQPVADPEEELKGVKKLKNLPKTGEPGDRVNIDGELYAYTEGLYDSTRQRRLREIGASSAVPANPLDDEAIANLLP